MGEREPDEAAGPAVSGGPERQSPAEDDGHRQRGRDTSMGQSGYCDACGEWVPQGPDACLGLIPGVSHACCGHGDACEAYVVIGGRPDEGVSELPDAVTLRGDDARLFFALVERGQWKSRPGSGPPRSLHPGNIIGGTELPA